MVMTTNDDNDDDDDDAVEGELGWWLVGESPVKCFTYATTFTQPLSATASIFQVKMTQLMYMGDW